MNSGSRTSERSFPNVSGRLETKSNAGSKRLVTCPTIYLRYLTLFPFSLNLSSIPPFESQLRSSAERAFRSHPWSPRIESSIVSLQPRALCGSDHLQATHFGALEESRLELRVSLSSFSSYHVETSCYLINTRTYRFSHCCSRPRSILWLPTHLQEGNQESWVGKNPGT